MADPTPLDINDFVYSTGTLTIAPGDTTAVFADATVTAGTEDGDWLFAGGAVGVIQSYTDGQHAELFTPWAGAEVTDGPYIILKASLLRWHSALSSVRAMQVIAMLDGLSVIYAVTGAAPDPSIGEDGNYALKTNAGTWQFWLKVGGAWVLQSTPVGATWRGAWNSATAYVANDTVNRLGSTYISLSTNTNAAPESNPSDWALSAAKGDPGRDGGPVTIAYTFSTTTSDSDPGNGNLRLNQATQNTATFVYADLLDTLGVSWSAALDAMAGSSSAVKGYIRLYKTGDLSKWILFTVGGVTTATGYRKLSVLPVASSDASPFSNGDAIALTWDRNGDKGDTGLIGAKGMVQKGTWASVTAYAVDDVVLRSGSSYIAIQSGTNKDPVSEPTYWSLVASKGDKGDKGDTPVIAGTSTSNVIVGTGAKSFTTQSGLGFSTAQRLRIATADSSKVMVGTVTSYSTTALVMDIDETVGSGADTSWNISITGSKGTTGDTGKSILWKGMYSSVTAYNPGEIVSYSGKDYINKLAGTNQQPDTATAYWDLLFDPNAPADQIIDQPKSADYAAASGDRATMLRFTASATLSPAAAATLTNGWYCYVKADGGNVTIDPDGSELIDGGITLVLTNGSACVLICNGTGFITFRTSSGGGTLASIPDDVKTADYTVVLSDAGKRIVMSSASARTISLLAAATAGGGFAFWVRNINTGTLTIDGDGSESIDGELSFVLDKDEEALLSCTGTGWRKRVYRSEGHLEPETDVATGSTMDIGATNTERVRATGTTTVASFGTRARKVRRIRFTGQTTVQHNGTSLFLPGEANLTFDANDIIEAVSDASGNWRVVDIQKNLSPARGRLTGDRTYYVRPDGNDNNNTGLANTSGGAFLTIQKAIDIATTIDFNGKTVIIQLADGTYTAGGIIPIMVGQGSYLNLVIQGNATTPANVVISTTAAHCIQVVKGAAVFVKDFKVQTTTSGNGIFVVGGYVGYSGINFGTCVNRHIRAEMKGIAECLGNYAISGNATTHVQSIYQSFARISGFSIAVTNSPTFSTVLGASTQSAVWWQNMTVNVVSGSAISGSKYDGALQSAIQTFGGGSSSIPGGTVGTLDATSVIV